METWVQAVDRTLLGLAPGREGQQWGPEGELASWPNLRAGAGPSETHTQPSRAQGCPGKGSGLGGGSLGSSLAGSAVCLLCGLGSSSAHSDLQLPHLHSGRLGRWGASGEMWV